MDVTLRSPRASFRQFGRAVLLAPADAALHEQRILAALALEGSEPLQGAVADMLHACPSGQAQLRGLLDRTEVAARLAPFVVAAFGRQLDAAQRLPRVSTLATRWSVLTAPSLDVPARAVLCSVDDARGIAAKAIPHLLQNDAEVEQVFLDHCEGAGDSLAFMLARRTLQRAGHVFSPRWNEVSDVLQQLVRR